MMSKPERYVFVCVQSRPPGHPRGDCVAKGSIDLLRAFQNAFEARKLWGRFALTNCGCIGPCDLGPNVLVYPEGIMYTQVQVADIEAIIDEHLLGGVPVRRLYPAADVWSNK
ncbi:MAG: (2Fe-2S) ferredoxin domain-containing protein [Halothiobacillus sp.]